MVLIAYIDESYQRDHFFMAAAVAEDEVWSELGPTLDAVRRRTAEAHGTPLDVEFHAFEIMGGDKSWACLRGKHREAAAIYLAVLAAARDAGVKFILRGVDVARLNARYKYPQPPHQVVLQHTLERVNEYALATKATELVPVIADEVSEEAVHRSMFDDYQAYGTPGYRRTRLDRLASPIEFRSSRYSNGLQVADMAAYLHQRRSIVEETHPAARRTRARLVSELDAATASATYWSP